MIKHSTAQFNREKSSKKSILANLTKNDSKIVGLKNGIRPFSHFYSWENYFSRIKSGFWGHITYYVRIYLYWKVVLDFLRVYWVGVLGSSLTGWQKWGGFQENCPANKTTNGSEWRSHNRQQLGSVWITSDHPGTKIQDHGKRTFQSVIKGTKVQNQGTVHYTKWSGGDQKYRIGESLQDRRGQK